jgi:1-acyl-sn-glycerol-3-phosphate acyltransferase
MNKFYADHRVISHLYRLTATALFLPRLTLFFFVLVAYVPTAWALSVLADCQLIPRDIPRNTFRGVCRIILHILDLTLIVNDHRKIRAAQLQGSMLIANHVSYLDILVMGAAFAPAFVCKREVDSWPFFGPIARSLGCVFVDRGNLQSRVTALKRTSSKLEMGESLCVFPEGTTTFHGVPSRQRWSSGQISAAQSSKKPIIICGISYEDQESAAWFGNSSFVPHLVRQFLRGPRNVALSAEVWNGDENLSAREASARIHSKVCSLCVANYHQLVSQTAEVRYAYP